MTRQELAERLRWLAGEWRAADAPLRRKIEEAFNRGRQSGSPNGKVS